MLSALLRTTQMSAARQRLYCSSSNSSIKSSDVMPKVDMKEIHGAQLDFLKKVEKENIERVRRLKIMRRRNAQIGVLLCCFVAGIYSYTIRTVGQESFLDDLDES